MLCSDQNNTLCWHLSSVGSRQRTDERKGFSLLYARLKKTNIVIVTLTFEIYKRPGSDVYFMVM
ncbi:hypothetical protein A3Q56_02329 [Intoshia linei]|uniref:Uncharacterized protein n=1 Tax=Intoshia linei TaxID=1819745 RepID=A0A177B6G5_9BILA|nr:hypothetical protein A3Q56_02329 [Intoshia linei]